MKEGISGKTINQILGKLVKSDMIKKNQKSEFLLSKGMHNVQVYLVNKLYQEYLKNFSENVAIRNHYKQEILGKCDKNFTTGKEVDSELQLHKLKI